MSTLPPNIIEIIRQELEMRVKMEVKDAVERIVKEIKEKEPEMIARLTANIALEPKLMELGNIIRFEIKSFPPKD